MFLQLTVIAANPISHQGLGVLQVTLHCIYQAHFCRLSNRFYGKKKNKPSISRICILIEFARATMQMTLSVANQLTFLSMPIVLRNETDKQNWILTCFGQDGPSHEGDINASKGPASEEPAQELDSLRPRDEFTEVSDEYGQRTAQSGILMHNKEKKKKRKTMDEWKNQF